MQISAINIYFYLLVIYDYKGDIVMLCNVPHVNVCYKDLLLFTHDFRLWGRCWLTEVVVKMFIVSKFRSIKDWTNFYKYNLTYTWNFTLSYQIKYLEAYSLTSEFLPFPYRI